MTILLRDATYIDHESCEVWRGDLRVGEGWDGAVERLEDGAPPQPADTTIECAGRIVTRSFVVGHHHIYSALARGMPAPPRPPHNFREILELIWWRLDKALDDDMVRASAIAGAIDAAKAGTTMIIDHHASPNAAPGSLHAIAEELERVGLAHVLCYEMSDRDGAERRDAGLEETEAYLLSGGQGLVGMHASFTVGDELLSRCVAMADRFGTGLHVHVAEALSDEEHCQATYGKRCVERLRDAGALESGRPIHAHCIHLDDAEREIVRRSGVWVAQQTESNLNNAVGVLDAGALEGRWDETTQSWSAASAGAGGGSGGGGGAGGGRVMIGTDGMNGDCLGAARATYLAAQRAEPGGLSPAGAHRRLRAAHRYVAEAGFRGDGHNNLVVLGYAPSTPITQDNWPAHVVYGLSRADVETVISDGRVIVEAGRCTRIDEDECFEFAREQAQRLWSRLRDS